MNGVPLRVFLLSSSLCSLLLLGCSASPMADGVSLQPGARLSRDGVLRYRLPVGWFDVTADSQAVGHVIWVLKNDYRASVTVDEVHADAGARTLLGGRDLLQLARLLLPLIQSEKQAVVDEAPRLRTVGGRTYCVCELTTKENDALRYILFDAGRRVYAVTVLFAGGAVTWSSADTRRVQETFLGSLEW